MIPPVRHYQYSLPSAVELEKMMAHFYIYGDESGKLAQSDITSFCGFVSHASECERAMAEWNNCRFGWGVPPIHMRCIMNPERKKCEEWLKIKKDWGTLWEKKRDLMLSEFGEIILRSHMAAVGCCVDAAHFRSMPETDWKKNVKDPAFLGLFILIMDSLDKVDKLSDALPVSIVLDDDEQYAMSSYQLLNALKAQFPHVRKRITAITFGNDKEYPALQMADMIAYESRSLMVQRATNKDAPPSDLYKQLTKRGVHQITFWTAEFLDKAAALNQSLDAIGSKP